METLQTKLDRASYLLFFILLYLMPACTLLETKDLLRPNGVAVTAQGQIFVMDRGHYRVVEFSDTLKYIRSFGHLGRGNEGILRGWDIGIDSKKNIFLANVSWTDEFETKSYDCIKQFDKYGRFIKDIGVAKSNRFENRSSPYGVHIGKNDRIYVPSYFTSFVRIFDNNGVLLGTIDVAKEGQFKPIRGVNDIITTSDDSYLYVTDILFSEVRKYHLRWNRDGQVSSEFIGSVGGEGKPPYLLYPQYLALDEENKHLFISDLGHQRVVEVLENGDLVREYKLNAKWQPFGIVLDLKKRLLVADAYGNQIVRFSRNGEIEESNHN